MSAARKRPARLPHQRRQPARRSRGLGRAGAANHLPPAPELTAVTLQPPEKKTTDAKTLAAYAGSLLLLTTLALYGQWVLTGVVEEKSNRVVELILATVRPRHLMAGKVIGIGLLGLGQVALVGGLTAVLFAVRALRRADLDRRQPRPDHPLVRARLRPLRGRLRSGRRARLAAAGRQLGRDRGHLHAPRRLLPRLRRPRQRHERPAREPADDLPGHRAARAPRPQHPDRRAALGTRARGRARARDDLRPRAARRSHLRTGAAPQRPAHRPPRRLRLARQP